MRLSLREREVIGLIAHGYSDKEIAGRLGISLSTVKTYLWRAYRRNEFRNRAEAVAALSGLSRTIDETPSHT